MSRRALLTGWVIVVLATVAIVLAVYGTAEEGLRVAVRATARLSALATACAFAGIRTRDALVALPISHTAHYAVLVALATATTPANAGVDVISAPIGAAVLGLMIATAVKPRRWAIYFLWIVFLVAIGINMRASSLLYPLMVALLVAAAVVRFAPRRVESATTT